MDLLGDLSVGPCTGYLVVDTCRYYMMTFYMVRCINGRVQYQIALSGTAESPPATLIKWTRSDIKSTFEIQNLNSEHLYQEGDQCDASQATVQVTPVVPEDVSAILDECFPRKTCIKPDVILPFMGIREVNRFPLVCCSPCSEGGASQGVLTLGSTGDCATGSCRVQYNVENGNILHQLHVPAGDVITPAVVFTINTTHPGPMTLFGYRVSTFLGQRVMDGYLGDDRDAGVVKCDGSIEVHTCKPEGPGDYYPPVGSQNRLTKNSNSTWTETVWDGSRFDYDTSGWLYRITNPQGAVWTIVGGSTPSYVADPVGRRLTATYDSMTGRFNGIRDPFGRITTVTLDGNNQLTQFITPELCMTELRYHADHRLAAVLAPSGERVSLAYTGDGLCSNIFYPNGSQHSFAYNDWLSTTITNPDSSQTQIRHAYSRQVASTTSPVGSRMTYTYDGGLIRTAKTPSGAVTTYSYFSQTNGLERLTSTTTADGRTSFVYDGSSRVSATVNPVGVRTTYTRNAAGLAVSEINALGQRTTWVYDAFHRIAGEIRPLGIRSTTVYASSSMPIAIVNSLGSRTTYSYTNGQRIAAKNPVGAISSTVYDRNNRPLVTIDPLGQRTSSIYNSGCAPVATIQANGARTTNIYSFGKVKATMNPLGQRTSFAYDTAGRRIRTQTPMNRVSTTVYDAAGRSIASISPAGLRSTTVYDSSSRPIATIDPAGLRSTTIYDTCCSKPKAIIAPNGSRTTFVYNKLGSQIRTVAPTGAISTTVYDVLNRPVATIDPLGKRSTTVYDAAGRTVASVNALGQRTTSVYNVANQGVASVNALGYRSTQVYDAAGRAIASVNPLGKRWTTVYDLAGRSTASVDPLNRRSTSVYNKVGAVTASINAAGNRSTTVYNIAGQTIASIDAKGARSTTTYNPDRQTVASINALGYRTTQVYDAGGRGVASVDAKGNRSTTVYSSVGRTAAAINPLGKRWTTVYNSVGQTVGSKDPLGNRSTTVYDSAGRAVASINPLGKRTTTVYNIASQSLATIDANGNRVSSIYDALGRRTVEINGLGNRTSTVYNAVGQTSALVDARGNRHSFTYDSTGAQTQLIDPLNRRTTSAYDAAGQQTLRIDARSNRTTYTFSSLSQLTGRKYPDGSRVTFTYDSVGNRTLMADSTGRYTSTYDLLGQATSIKVPNNQRMTYSYDGVGLRRFMDATGSGRFTSTFSAAGQLATLSNPFGERTTFSYDDSGRRTVQRNANGTRVSMSYDAASQTTQVFHRTSVGASILQLDYRYDNAGNRNVMIEGGGTARVTWSYDQQNQLLGEYRTGTNAYRQTYTYDAAGNRTLKNIDGTRTTYAYDNANQLRYGHVIAGRTTYVYDATGNQRIEQPAVGNRTTTTWNYENQPTQYRLSAGGSPVTMTYNGDNRRMLSQQGSASTKFVWDAVTDAYVAELDGSNILIATYTNEPQLFGGVLSQRRGTTSSILHADSLGTTRLLTGYTQTTTDSYLFDAWGNTITSSGTTVNPFRWMGRYSYYTDDSTEQIYIRAKMYMPTASTWTSSHVSLTLIQHLYRRNRRLSQGDANGGPSGSLTAQLLRLWTKFDEQAEPDIPDDINKDYEDECILRCEGDPPITTVHPIDKSKCLGPATREEVVKLCESLPKEGCRRFTFAGHGGGHGAGPTCRTEGKPVSNCFTCQVVDGKVVTVLKGRMQEIADCVRARLAKDGYVRLCSCGSQKGSDPGSQNSPEEIKLCLDFFAAAIRAKVCACDQEVRDAPDLPYCHCTGRWICRNPPNSAK